MEKLLLKLAQQLDSLDEASLMALWNKYARITCAFEPTKRWENAALVLCLIQAKHMKNQLFNYNWSLQAKERSPEEDQALTPPPVDFSLDGPADPSRPAKKCRILPFVQDPSSEQ